MRIVEDPYVDTVTAACSTLALVSSPITSVFTGADALAKYKYRNRLELRNSRFENRTHVGSGIYPGFPDVKGSPYLHSMWVRLAGRSADAVGMRWTTVIVPSLLRMLCDVSIAAITVHA
jgi:hypothetical protein